jgi:hypothetical protein
MNIFSLDSFKVGSMRPLHECIIRIKKHGKGDEDQKKKKQSGKEKKEVIFLHQSL